MAFNTNPGKQSFTATSGQTTFSGADDNAATLAYTAGKIMVVMNGVVLDPSDFTATNGTSVVLDTGATADLTISGSTMTTTGFNHLYAFTPSGWASAAGVGFRSIFVFDAEL